jgi:hypothetical protein
LLEFGDVISQWKVTKNPHSWRPYQRQRQRTWTSWQVGGGEPIQTFILEDPQRALDVE